MPAVGWSPIRPSPSLMNPTMVTRVRGAAPPGATVLRLRRTVNSLAAAAKGAALAVPETDRVRSLGVVGAGQMGMGIALVAARKAEVPVTLVDNSERALRRSISFAEGLLAKDVAKDRLTAEASAAVRARISPTTDMGELGGVDFVIEAVPEALGLKRDVFGELARVCTRTHVVLATNTSSISITKMAAAAAAAVYDDQAVAARVVGTHFMNPVPYQRGVEIIAGLQTAPRTLDVAVAFCRALGKTPSTSADVPGFLANRILMPYINEAIICLETSVGDRDSIDAIMKNGTNVPMGPLTLADFIGLDTCLAIMRVLHSEIGDDKYRPSVLLVKMVDAGWLGRKSGKGFYDY